jgi:hypothetical protein
MTAVVSDALARPRPCPRSGPAGLVPRRLPAPRTEPPYDDERGRVTGLAVVEDFVGQLELPLSFGTGRAGRPALRLLQGALAEAPAVARELGDPRPVATQFAQLLLDAVAGGRSASALQSRASTEVYRGIAKLASRAAREHRPGTRNARPALSSLHVSEPEPEVVEACAVARFGPRRRAIALRFEGVDGRWQCTAIELG